MYTANAQLLEAFNKEHEYLKTKLDLGREILWLTKDECIQAGPDVEETLELVKGAMIAHGRNEYEMPAKIGIHPYEDVFFHAMPAYVPGNLACGCKWIECYPRNPKDYGLPQTTGLQEGMDQKGPDHPALRSEYLLGSPDRADRQYIVDSIDEHELFAGMGYFPDGLPKIACQTGEVLAGIAEGRTGEDEIIVCSNIGISTNDVAMGQAILTKALEMGIGTRMKL